MRALPGGFSTLERADRQCNIRPAVARARRRCIRAISRRQALKRMARPKILVFQHVPYEPLGTLDPLLRGAGFRIRYVNFGRDPLQRPRLARYAGLIVLGGPMSADDVAGYPNLATEVALIREAIDREMSVLGICLGAQLLARALGGRVVRGAAREFGWQHVELTGQGAADPVLGSFADRQRVFQWHEDGIELPPGVEHLASSAAWPVQAFRSSEHVYGFQFHLEVSALLIERWLRVPENRSVIEDEEAGICPATVREQTARYVAATESLSRSTFGRWIDRFETGPRRLVLPSH